MRKTDGKPQPFGAVIQKDGVNFAVSVPEGKTCELLIYRRGQKKIIKEFDMPEEEGIGEVRFLELTDLDPRKYEYNYRIDGKVCLDPWVKGIAGHREFGTAWDAEAGEARGMMPVQDYDWEGDKRPKIPYHEVIAYSLHVRGFTKHSSSRVKHKGTFAGAAEKIPYLKELGINQIQCMPVYEFEELQGGKCNYWGYGKGHYLAPKAAYSASGDAQTELRDMVKAFHREGIEVILDMPFCEGILPQEALECLKYYLLEYHVDGFLVNPYLVIWDSLKQDPLLKGVKLLKKEEWFQNTMRRFLKGDEGMVSEVIWALGHRADRDGCCNYVTSHTGFTLCDLVSYDGKHNEANGERNLDGPDYNYSWNCGVEGPSRKKHVLALRRNQVRNAFFLLLTAQGTPCILAGDEFGNTQYGNNNVYCQDNETAWLNWNRKKGDEELLDFVKELIRMRRENPILHQERELSGSDQTACGIPDVSYHGESAWQVPDKVASRQLGVFYSRCEGESQECFIAYNMHWMKHEFALPALPKGRKWTVTATTEDGVLKETRQLENQKKIEVKERTVVLLHGEKAAKEPEKKDKKHEESNSAFLHNHETQNTGHEGVLPGGTVQAGIAS